MEVWVYHPANSCPERTVNRHQQAFNLLSRKKTQNIPSNSRLPLFTVLAAKVSVVLVCCKGTVDITARKQWKAKESWFFSPSCLFFLLLCQNMKSIFWGKNPKRRGGGGGGEEEVWNVCKGLPNWDTAPSSNIIKKRSESSRGSDKVSLRVSGLDVVPMKSAVFGVISGRRLLQLQSEAFQ